MLEVAELVKPCETFHGVGRKRVVVAAGDLEQGLGPDRPFQVHVELDLRAGHVSESRQRAEARPASVDRCQRRSMKTASQIESSYSVRSGIVSKTSDTGSAVGRSTA